MAPILTAFVFTTAVFFPKAIPVENGLIFAIICLAFPFSMFIDFFCIFYSSEILEGINWVDTTMDAKFSIRQRPNKKGRVGILDAFMNAIFYPKALPFEDGIIFALVSIIFPFSVFFDFLIFFYSSELLTAVNWTAKTTDTMFVNRQRSKSKHLVDVGRQNVFLKEVYNIFRGNPVDWVGLFLYQLVIFYGLVSVVAPVVLVWGDWDPFQIALIILASPHAPFRFPDITASLWSKLFRGILMFSISQALFANVRTLSIIGANSLFGYIKLLKRILTLELNHHVMQEYKEMHIVIGMLESPLKILFAILLQTLFMGIVLGTNMTIIGLQLRNLVMIYIAFTIMIVAVPVSFLVFWFGCSLYETSEAILHSWRWQLVWKSRRGYVRRIVRSFRKLALTAGGIGVLDDTIRNTFYHSSFTYTANLLIAARKVYR
ncbi:unnamed protein product [Orchesella dallaii]|uniref:Odorant receptor n=1 Tax=Orchesella dallaii TaxID=48710 RepID=A0ABP1RGM6_9HEXA